MSNAYALEARDVSKRFGGIVATNHVSIQVEKGKIFGIIGPNGAGKTTLFNIITGVYSPTEGKVLLDGEDLTGKQPYQISRAGLARTFQNIRLFNDLTVYSNIHIAYQKNMTYSVLQGVFRTKAYKEQETDCALKCEKLLKSVGLWELRDQLASNLPYGVQRRLEIARALATSPKVLLLDEPAAGMNEQESEELCGIIRDIPRNFEAMRSPSSISASNWPPVRPPKFRRIRRSSMPTLAWRIDMLKIDDLYFRYGKITALNGVRFEVQPGEIMSIVGANGAGKSTLMRCIAGLLKPQSGQVSYNDKVLPYGAHSVLAEGIALVPEGRWIFPNLTVEENLLMGGYLVKDRSAGLERSYTMFSRLKERSNQRAGTLSGGEQQMLAIARGLMSDPKVLLLDEPSLGLAPQIVNDVMRIIDDINQSGVTILLVEQNARKALKIAHHACVMAQGRMVQYGTGDEIAESGSVISSYLGKIQEK